MIVKNLESNKIDEKQSSKIIDYLNVKIKTLIFKK